MIITKTPFRVSFFGGGSDFPDFYKKHGGAVLSTTIDKYLYLTCRNLPPYWEYKHQFIYGSKNERVNRIEEIVHPSIRETMKFLEINKGIDLHYNTDIPARSGMGSSSSFTVGLLNSLYGLRGIMVSKDRLAKEAIHIEQELIGEAVGSQDQIAAAYGGFNHIVFNKDGSFEVQPIIIENSREKMLNNHLLLVFTGFQRYAIEVEEDKIKRIDANKETISRMKDLTSQAIEILTTNSDIREFGALMNEGWLMKKRLSKKVSNPTIDNMYEKGLKNGAIGGKLLGAGGGGFLLFFVEPQKREELLKSLGELINIAFSFDKTGSQVIYYKNGEY